MVYLGRRPLDEGTDKHPSISQMDVTASKLEHPILFVMFHKEI